MRIRRDLPCPWKSVLTALLATLACSEPDEPTVHCSEAPSALVSGEIVRVRPSGVIEGEVTVEGTAWHDLGAAIRTVRVLGIPAENTGFNFATWEVRLPYDVLVAEARESGPQDDQGRTAITITAVAWDACNLESRPFPAPGRVVWVKIPSDDPGGE